MMKLINIGISCLLLSCFYLPAAFAQGQTPEDKDDSSEQVEQREDSYRRQMELEDARSGERTYIDNTYTQSATAEKIDKLPEESRDNIRDQLVDIIVENGEWEPRDALEEYPYQPTAAAEADSELKEQELAAWDEQVEKYHQREAAAFGSHRGPVPGPGNPSGAEGGQQGEGSEGQQAGGQGSGGEGEESESSTAGTYQPGKAGSSSSENEVSTAGVSESALDFLRGGQAQSQQQTQQPSAQSAAQAQADSEAQAQAAAEAQALPASGTQTQAAAEAQAQEQAENNPEQSAAEYLAEQSAQENPPEASEQTANQSAEQDSEQEQSEQQDSPADVPIDLRGIIAIEDLNKLEGTRSQDQPEDPENP